MELAVGDVAGRCRWIVGLPDDGDLIATLLEMAVDAVGRDVEGAVLEPFDRDIGIGEGRVLDAGIGLDPVDTFAVLAPKRLGVSDRSFVHGAVHRVVDQGGFCPNTAGLD